MPSMATRQKTPSKTRSGSTIFALIIVLGLIALVFYFGFIKVD